MGVVGETISAGHSEGKKPQKTLWDRDFHLPRLAVPKMRFQTQGATARILEVSVPLCRRSVEYLSWSWRSGVHCPSECPGHRGAALGRPEGWSGEGIWEEAMQSLTARRRPDVFIIMEKICWCLFAQRNTGGGNSLLSSDQSCILKMQWARVKNQQKWEEGIFSDSCSNIQCEGAPKACTASPGIFSQITASENWRDRP